MIRRPPRSTLDRSSAASDVYKRQLEKLVEVRTAELRQAKDALEGDIKRRQLVEDELLQRNNCLLYTSPSPRDRTRSRMPSSAWKKKNEKKKKKMKEKKKTKKDKKTLTTEEYSREKEISDTP